MCDRGELSGCGRCPCTSTCLERYNTFTQLSNGAVMTEQWNGLSFTNTLRVFFFFLFLAPASSDNIFNRAHGECISSAAAVRAARYFLSVTVSQAVTGYKQCVKEIAKDIANENCAKSRGSQRSSCSHLNVFLQFRRGIACASFTSITRNFNCLYI